MIYVKIIIICYCRIEYCIFIFLLEDVIYLNNLIIGSRFSSGFRYKKGNKWVAMEQKLFEN